jgi:hypothetical protein
MRYVEYATNISEALTEQKTFLLRMSHILQARMAAVARDFLHIPPLLQPPDARPFRNPKRGWV